MRQNSILFLHESTLDDGLALALVCERAKNEGLSVTAVDIAADNAVNIAEATFGLSETVDVYYRTDMTARVDNFLRNVEYEQYRMFSVPYATPPCVQWSYANANPELVRTINYLYMADPYSLPSIVAYMLMRKMGVIDFANYIMEHGSTPLYDIVRDDEAIACLSPERTA